MSPKWELHKFMPVIIPLHAMGIGDVFIYVSSPLGLSYLYCLNLCYHTMTNIVYTTVYTKHMCNVPPLLQATDTFLETIALVARPSSFSSDSWGKLQRA